MTGAIDPTANQLLKALARNAPGPWLQGLELIDLPLGTVLHEPYVDRRDVYFPVSAVISLLHVLEDGSSAEIAVIGKEGVVGISLFMGDGITPSRAVVQCAGSAIRLDARLLRSEFVRRGQVALLLLRFTQALIAQMSQTAVCNRHHLVEQHLCRWILLMLDRHAGDQIVMTQELIADMLGVRRASVSTAAAALQKEGLITYRRGRLRVLDRSAIEQRVCECYAVVKSEYDRLLPALEEVTIEPVINGMRNDELRLDCLKQTGILDTPPDPAFDKIASRTAELLEVPIAMISFLDSDRDWFKSCVGFAAREAPAETSFCNVFFSTDDDVIVVPNTLADDRFASHHFVRGMPFIRFFAAARLVDKGHTIGTLCIYDMRERAFGVDEVQALRSLAAASLEAMNSGIYQPAVVSK